MKPCTSTCASVANTVLWNREPETEDDALPVPLEAIQAPLAAVNVGLESFYNGLVAQGARAVQVEWKPPAGGNEKLAGILARMKGTQGTART